MLVLAHVLFLLEVCEFDARRPHLNSTKIAPPYAPPPPKVEAGLRPARVAHTSIPPFLSAPQCPRPHKKKRRPVASGGGFKSLGWFACYPPSLPVPEHTNRQHAQRQQARTILWQQFLMRKAYTQSVNGSNSSIPPYDRIWTQAERKDPKTNGRQPSRPTSRSNQYSMPRFVLRAYLELPHQGLRRFEWTTVSSLASLSSLWLFLGRSQTLLYSQRSEY